MKGHDFK